MTGSPRVTVLMAVHNGECYLQDAIGSILGQTFADFEFLVIDDGSTDGSAAIVEAFGDPRVRLVKNGENRGLAASLNRGLELACGEFVARMDADDLSLPLRLARQVAFLDRHPAVGVCGSWIRYLGETEGKVVRYPADPEVIRAGLLFDPMVAHPSVMLRREPFLRHGLRYDTAFRRSQDYELWARAAHAISFSNVPEVLLLYRSHPSQSRALHRGDQEDAAGRVRRSLLSALGIEPTEEEFAVHQALSTCRICGDRTLFARADRWLCLLREANMARRVYDVLALDQVLAGRWLTFLKKGVAETGAWREIAIRRALFAKGRVRWGLGLRVLLDEAAVRLRG